MNTQYLTFLQASQLFTGWSDDLKHDGEYYLSDWFDAEGYYVGADIDGVEPVFDCGAIDPSVIQIVWGK